MTGIRGFQMPGWFLTLVRERGAINYSLPIKGTRLQYYVPGEHFQAYMKRKEGGEVWQLKLVQTVQEQNVKFFL
ncbi:hypothetical protein CDAR_216571 [Caerostris darwini]|uniref:Uncharacterized protein n=1 Tax=Caerostris darwini TaxID=1538125 RepID=A0AAV4PMG2_9ARAC|nr:hypothetical protein CDAR_216571 [Caerostris darwini]